MQDSAADALTAGKVLAGDPGGYAELYDRHAAEMHEYCVTMLGSAERALGALSTTFMIAAGRMAELADPGRLRPWLFALARDECRRRARSTQAPVVTGAAVTGADGNDNAALFAAALGSLSWDDREAIQLCLRHHLIGQDLTDVLGMPASRVRAAVTDARVRLQRALGALFVARTGRADCRGLAGMLKGWDGCPDEPAIQRIRGHIGSCATCRMRELRELPSWEVLTARPGPDESPLPHGVRARVLALLAGVDTPTGNLIGDLVRHRAGTFGTAGFPGGRIRDNRRSPVQVAGAAAGVAAAGAVIIMFAAIPGTGSPSPALVQATKSAGTSAAAGSPVARSVGPHARPKAAHQHQRRQGARPAVPASAATPHSISNASAPASAGAVRPARSPGSSGSSGSAPPSGSPSPSAPPSPGGSASSAPAPSVSTSASPAGPATSPPSPPVSAARGGEGRLEP